MDIPNCLNPPTNVYSCGLHPAKKKNSIIFETVDPGKSHIVQRLLSNPIKYPDLPSGKLW